MQRYYCHFCDMYLSQDSPSVRKTHCTGRKHRDNVQVYYQFWMERHMDFVIEVKSAERNDDDRSKARMVTLSPVQVRSRQSSLAVPAREIFLPPIMVRSPMIMSVHQTKTKNHRLKPMPEMVYR